MATREQTKKIRSQIEQYFIYEVHYNICNVVAIVSMQCI